MLCNYQIKIADIYNIAIGNVKKLVPTFLIKKGIWFFKKTCNLT